MSDPVIIRIVRPYHSADEYLAAEADTFQVKSMLLLGADSLPEGTQVRFVIRLISGEAVVKAEGRVQGTEERTRTGEAGLRVAFRRFGAMTKQFIDRAVALGSMESIAVAGQPEPADIAFLTGAARSSYTEPTAPVGASTRHPTPAPAEICSGVRHRIGVFSGVPANRDELLERLRQRNRVRPPEVWVPRKRPTGS